MSLRWKFFILIFIAQWAMATAVFATDKTVSYSDAGKIAGWIKKARIKIEDIPNPHWQAEACSACHRAKAGKKNLHLRAKGINATCNNCHMALADHIHIHPLDVAVPKSMSKRMPASFRKTLGRKNKSGESLSCSTCHDILMQCIETRFPDKKINPKFIRGGPYRSRTQLCYQCHDNKAYQRLNSHDQIADDGEVLIDKCLICHMRLPKELDDGTVINAELQIKTDYSAMCLNCHRWTPHPGGDVLFLDKGGPMHLVKPSAGIRQHMLKMEKINSLILPLEEDNGKIYCATCHNPHERGVLKNKRAARGADEPKRLRSNPMCENCHDL
ncbi:hypothetical protein MNBD_GAMMA25-830 [hydrothermal vent metagenome]|uniref:Uncharacterized protein n=1 Tax=hydrothermal vent metagenome TaxID=652676 RepID=A0A3B1AXP9_9ZZZZ